MAERLLRKVLKSDLIADLLKDCTYDSEEYATTQLTSYILAHKAFYSLETTGDITVKLS